MKKIIGFILFGFMIAANAVTLSLAEEAAAPTRESLPAPDSSSVQTAIVTLDGQPLFRVRGMTGYTAEDRANAISDRIAAVAANSSVLPEAVSVEQLPDRSELRVGDTVLAAILDADAQADGVPRELLSTRARVHIIEAIKDYRHDRSPMRLLRQLGIAAMATLVWILLMQTIRRLYMRVLRIAERQVKARVDALEKRTSKVIESRTIWSAFVGLIRTSHSVVLFILGYFYLNFILGLFPWTRPVAIQLFSIFIEPLRSLGVSFIRAIPNLVFLTILFLLVRYLIKVTRLFFTGIDNGTFTFDNFDSDWAWPTYRLLRLFLICFGVVVAYPHIPGSDSGAFKGVSLFVGLLFSLGSTSFIANIVGGFALTYRRAFRVGDIIKVDDTTGWVVDMKLQATHLRTRYNEVIVIPNSVLLNSSVINYSTMAKVEGLILHVTIGIGYEVPWRQVESMLLLAAERTPEIRRDKKPFVLQRVLDTFCVQYELNVYCEIPIMAPLILHALHKNILDVFNEYGVQIMTPAYEGDPPDPKIVTKEKMFAAPAIKPEPG